MAPSLRYLSAGLLLALVALTALIIAYSGGGQPGLQNPAVGQDHPAVNAQQPQATPEAPKGVGQTAPIAPQKPLAQRGPILLPLNPPYLASPIEQQPATPLLRLAEVEPSRAQQQSAATAWDEPQESQPAEEKQPVAITPEPPAEERPPAAETAEETQPAAEETAAEERPAAGEPAEEEQPSQTAAETSPQQVPETTLPETSTPPEPQRELTPNQVALRDRLRRTIAFHHGQAFSASENTATEVMHFCLAFGCNTELYRSRSSGKKVNGITCLCWNYPCAGYELLGLSQGRIAPRIGYGLQEQPAQLLAVLALARVKPTYPLRVGEDVRTVADLVEYEKLSCRFATDLSLKLIGLAYYVGDEQTWKNSLGDEWSIARMVEQELEQPVLGAACGGTQRLMGLSYALAQFEKRRRPIEGPFSRARKLIDQFHDHALKLQNPDGSWGPEFLAARGTTRDPALQLRSTGQVLEWLAMSLPKDRLGDPRVVRSVELVNRLLSDQRSRRDLSSLSTREIGSLMHALHALVVYDERFFGPATAQTPSPDAT